MKKIGRRGFLNLCQSAGIMSLFPFGAPVYLSGCKDPNKNSQETSPQNNLDWPKYVQEFPSLTLDKKNNPWIAVLERYIHNKKIKIYSYRKEELFEVAVIQPEGITGISAPSVSLFEDSIIITFSIEKNNNWE